MRIPDANLGSGSYITVTSLYDNARQDLNAAAIAQWQNSSAYFNGDALRVELYVAPGDRDIFIQVDEIMVGEHGAPLGPPQGQCGPTDDRVPSSDDRMGRLVDFVCTAFLIGDGSLVTAGHCILDPDLADTVQFNVPASLPSGTIQHPGPEDQYAIDNSSREGAQGTVGEDWGVFETFANTQKGLTAIEAQGTFFNLAQDLDPPTLRVTGYGTDDGTANQTQQTHAGPNAGSSGTTMRYRTDTEMGNSGSPVIHDANGIAVGVHTDGGCFDGGGYNKGTSTFNTAFWAEVGNVGNAQYSGLCSHLANEVAVVLQDEDDVIRVTIYYADGTYALPPTVFDWDDRINNNCVLRVETNGAGGAPPGTVIADQQLTTFFFEDMNGSGSARFTYTACNPEVFGEVDDGFYCPPIFWSGSAGLDHDLWVVFEGGDFNLVPQGLTGEFGPDPQIGGIQGVLGGGIMPYDNDKICDAPGVSCPSGWEDDYNIFLTFQTGSPHTPYSHDYDIGNWTVPAGETWYWHLAGNTLTTLNLARDVNGTLELGGLTMEGQGPESGGGGNPWGLDIADTGNVKIVGDVTFTDPDFIDVEGSFQIPANGDLTANGGTYRFAGGKSLQTYGRLDADDVTFTELNAGDGWWGLIYQDGSDGVLRGVTIEDFGYVPAPGLIAPFICGLTVYNEWKAVYRSFIQDGINGAYGVCSFGDEGQISLRGEIDPVS